MSDALLEMTKEEIAKKYEASQFRVFELEQQLIWLKKQVFGPKSERIIIEDKSQLLLNLGITENAEPQPAEPEMEELNFKRRKPKKGKGNENLKYDLLPAHLPRIIERIEPEGDLEGTKEIGVEVTSTLEMTPPLFYVKELHRVKRITVGQPDKGVMIAPLPVSILQKFKVGMSLLAWIIVSKYVDHLPFYRQIEIMKRFGIRIPMSTGIGWIQAGADALEVLYDKLQWLIFSGNYLQADETRMPVLESKTKGKLHTGQFWTYFDPVRKLVLFNYQETRGSAGPKELLKNFKGHLQSDGYTVYDNLDKRFPEIIFLSCWVHARRYFHKALDSDRKRAEAAMVFIQNLYEIEEYIRENNLTFEERFNYRQQNAIPVLDKFKSWLIENLSLNNTPKTPLAVAISYTLTRWEKLCVYTTKGELEIDNNLAENAIRPIAIGRKNFMFAGTHISAQRAAILCSLLATCKYHDVNPLEWLEDVLTRIASHPINRIEELLPHNWKAIRMAQAQTPA